MKPDLSALHDYSGYLLAGKFGQNLRQDVTVFAHASVVSVFATNYLHESCK